MWINDKDFMWGLLLVATVIAIGGWAIIELLCWVFDNISISWG